MLSDEKRQLWRDIAPLFSIAAVIITSLKLSGELGEKYGRLSEQVKGLDTRIQTIERRQEYLYGRLSSYEIPESTQSTEGNNELPYPEYPEKAPFIASEGIGRPWNRGFDSRNGD